MIKAKQHILDLVQFAYDNLDDPRVRDWKQNMSPWAFRQEFGLVKIKMPRQAGHTAAAVTLLGRYPGSLLFVPRGDDRQRIIREYRHYFIDEEILYRRDDHKQMMAGRSSNLEDFIFVPRDDDKLKRLRPNKPPLIIIDRADTFDFLQKEGIMSIFENARLIVELE